MLLMVMIVRGGQYERKTGYEINDGNKESILK